MRSREGRASSFLSFSGPKAQAGRMAPNNPEPRNHTSNSVQQLCWIGSTSFVSLNVYNRILKPNKMLILLGKCAAWSIPNRSNERGKGLHGPLHLRNPGLTNVSVRPTSQSRRRANAHRQTPKITLGPSQTLGQECSRTIYRRPCFESRGVSYIQEITPHVLEKPINI